MSPAALSILKYSVHTEFLKKDKMEKERKTKWTECKRQ
jgi:hypothetical protein